MKKKMAIENENENRKSAKKAAASAWKMKNTQ